MQGMNYLKNCYWNDLFCTFVLKIMTDNSMAMLFYIKSKDEVNKLSEKYLIYRWTQYPVK